MTRDELVNILDAIDCICAQLKPGAWFVDGWGSVDDVFHSLFDDFDRRDELNEPALNEMYRQLDQIFVDVGDADGAAFTQHASWPKVLEAAKTAREQLRRSPLLSAGE